MVILITDYLEQVRLLSDTEKGAFQCLILFLFSYQCFWKSSDKKYRYALFSTHRIATVNFFTITLNDRCLTMPSWVYHVYLRPLGSRWERHLPNGAVRLSASRAIMLHYESHELFLSLSGSHDIRRLRSSHTVISEVCGVATVVDFTNIPSYIFPYSSLCFIQGFPPRHGVYIEPRTICVRSYMLTQPFCTGDAAADNRKCIQTAKYISQGICNA